MQSQQKIVTVTLQPYSQGIPSQLRTKMETINNYNQTFIQYQSADCLLQYGDQIKQWNGIKLYVGYASKNGIIKAIGQISFPYLKTLWITKNNISSVEILGRLSAHNLQTIGLYSNQIINVSQLRKMQSNQLSSITIHHNPLNNAEFLTEVNCSALKQCQLPDSQINLSFFAKFEHKNQRKYSICIYDSKGGRVAEKKKIKSIIQKYSKRLVSIRTKLGIYTQDTRFKD